MVEQKSQQLYVYVKGVRRRYPIDSKVKFKVRATPRFRQKTFDNNIIYNPPPNTYITNTTYAIVDCHTKQRIIDFDQRYTSLSLNIMDGNYFILNMDQFEPHRFYKILLRKYYDDGVSETFDNGAMFQITSNG